MANLGRQRWINPRGLASSGTLMLLALLPLLLIIRSGYDGLDFRFHATSWLELHNAWIAHTGWRTCSARFSSCPGLRRQTPWRSRQHSSASGCSRRARPSCRSRAPTVAWHRTRPRAPATAACPPRCAPDEFVKRALISQARRRPIEKRVRTFGGSRRRDGRWRSIEPAGLAPRRSTSRVVWSMQSTPRRRGAAPASTAAASIATPNACKNGIAIRS